VDLRLGTVLSGSAAFVTVIAKIDNGQGLFMAGNAAAPGYVAVLAPGLMELAPAHLARRLVDAVKGIFTYDAGLFLQVFQHLQVTSAENTGDDAGQVARGVP